MAYIGIGYSGSDEAFLKRFVDAHSDWLNGDRQPRFHGPCFIVLYDSNTAREFVRKCSAAAPAGTLSMYAMTRPFDQTGMHP